MLLLSVCLLGFRSGSFISSCALQNTPGCPRLRAARHPQTQAPTWRVFEGLQQIRVLGGSCSQAILCKDTVRKYKVVVKQIVASESQLGAP